MFVLVCLKNTRMKNSGEKGSPVSNYSDEMVSLMLDNLLLEAGIVTINLTPASSRGPTRIDCVQKAIESCIYSPKGNQPSNLFSVVNNVSCMDTKDATNLAIKLEPDVENFEIENVPLEIATSNIGDTQPETPLLQLDNFKIIRNILGDHSYCAVFNIPSYGEVKSNLENFRTGIQNYLGMETSRAINDYEKLDEIVYKNKDLVIKEEDLEPKATRNKEYLRTQTESLLRLGTSQAINDTEKLHVYENWKIKNEEVDIEEEDLEHTEISISPSTSNGHLQQLNSRSSHLKQHLLRHKNPKKRKKFKCDVCEYQTADKSYLKKHVLRHVNTEEGKKLKCVQCDYQTFYDAFFKRHLLKHKNQYKCEKFKCDECEYQTVDRGYLKKHMVRHMNPEECEKFKCDICEYQTVRKSYLKSHVLRHMGTEDGKTFKCDQCKYQTFHNASFKWHLLRHKNPEEREKFKCDICEYQTVRKSYLKKHMLRHMGTEDGKTFKCDQCKYQTLDNAHFKLHLFLHKPKQFKCDQCEYQAYFISNLKRHMLQHRIRK